MKTIPTAAQIEEEMRSALGDGEDTPEVLCAIDVAKRLVRETVRALSVPPQVIRGIDIWQTLATSDMDADVDRWTSKQWKEVNAAARWVDQKKTEGT